MHILSGGVQFQQYNRFNHNILRRSEERSNDRIKNIRTEEKSAMTSSVVCNKINRTLTETQVTISSQLSHSIAISNITNVRKDNIPKVNKCSSKNIEDATRSDNVYMYMGVLVNFLWGWAWINGEFSSYCIWRGIVMSGDRKAQAYARKNGQFPKVDYNFLPSRKHQLERRKHL